MNTFDATLNVKQGFPVFSTHVEANHVQKTEDVYAAYKLTDEDNQKIHQMAADKRIGAPTPDAGFALEQAYNLVLQSCLSASLVIAAWLDHAGAHSVFP